MLLDNGVEPIIAYRTDKAREDRPKATPRAPSDRLSRAPTVRPISASLLATPPDLTQTRAAFGRLADLLIPKIR
ncbi:hypothetical protein GCM10027271_42950 [Saccharopolyspora gloriosae]